MINQENNEVKLSWDPYRTIFGLGRIGYTPPAAIGDIIDNSIRAKASDIKIHIIKRNLESLDGKKNNVKEYIIIDNGLGMNEKGILNALQLGSSNEDYEDNSLSKFGLGLKASAFSQGNVLEIISASEKNQFKKYVVSLKEIEYKKEYFAKKFELNEEDIKVISDNLHEKVGTIIRISDIRLVNHPSVKETIKELEYRLGIIYYYYIKEDNLKISIFNDSKQTIIEPYDVLFSDDANNNGNLDENEWNGIDARWIKRSQDPIVLDPDYNIQAIVEVVQLPHPPTFKPNDKEIRRKYKIEAGNYGYYVYRNKRLISWAERFGNIIPQDQDFYSFRGRILITDTADDAFNIDVKKSSIVLSDEASNTLNDLSADYKRKSKGAWKRAKELIKEKEGKEPNIASNKIVDDLEEPEFPGEKTIEEEKKEKEKKEEISKKMRKNMKELAIKEKAEKEGKIVTEKDITEEDILETLKGTTNPDVQKIFRVNNIFDNLLWEPYYDAMNGQCVRINKNHRFSKLIFEDNNSNTDLQIIYEVLLLNFAHAEFRARSSKKFDGINIEEHLQNYRYIISDYLTELCRQKENDLPPNNKEMYE